MSTLSELSCITMLQCDNAGENQAFQRASEAEGMGLEFEYTAPGTPKQNGHAEQKTLYGRALLSGCIIEKLLRNKLWAEAVITAM